MTEEEKRIFVQRWQARQGYIGTPVETIRNRVLIGLLLLVTGVVLAYYCGYRGK